MTEKAIRLRALGWGLACLAAFAVLAALVHGHWHPLDELDGDIGRGPFDVTVAHAWVRHLAIAIAHLFGTIAMTVATIVAGAILFVKKHRRAAYWTVGVMLAVGVATYLLKELVGRPRPVWHDPIQTLSSYAFPSGHSSSVSAGAAVAIVLITMLVRRRALRRLLDLLLVVVVVVVGADRVFLGVHHASDVLGGWLLGPGIVLVGLVVFDPTPRSIALTADPLPVVFATEHRRLAVVLNPVKIDDTGQFRSMVAAMAAESGFDEVRWWETTVEDTGHGMAHEAAVADSTVVVAVGGDGTVRAVCEELAGTGIPVGIVPAGTGNLLARNLDIPLYLRAAVDVALNGQDRAIDMVRVCGDSMEDATFLVMAGMGFDAAIMEGVNDQVKAKVGWLAYVWSALKSLMFPVIRVEVSVDGGEFVSARARTIVIGNVGHLQAGMPLLPDATIDDGELDVVLLYPRRFLSWLPLAARVMTRNPRTDETITRMTGRTVVVRTSTDAPRQLDGDLIQPGRELRAECVHGRLLVRVPR
ncbi:diacylglycerol kinase family protein [Nocardioides terrisoli]|uniref:diacylglycerol kinase family protein n=1 Tax=Nocardioides terrisoli TaxID=3388267 RepID=UPI00287BAD26|nr:diacylglycerol kinase family protein [Nocardioides marmorisolisilvae]